MKKWLLLAHNTWSVSTQPVPLFAQVGSGRFKVLKTCTTPHTCLSVLTSDISCYDPENPSPSAVAIVTAVVVMIGGAAVLVMIMICYRRWDAESVCMSTNATVLLIECLYYPFKGIKESTESSLFIPDGLWSLFLADISQRQKSWSRLNVARGTVSQKFSFLL